MTLIKVPPAHSKNSKEFHELTFAQQASSITAMINNLSNAMKHHILNSKDLNKTKIKCQNQAKRFSDRIKKI